MLLQNILIVGAGGMIGSMARYAFYFGLKASGFPIATFLVNIIGSLIIGVLAAFFVRNPQFLNWQLFLMTGICGGFTTFSAFSLEGFNMIREGRWMMFTSYFGGSIILGLVATFLGYYLAKQAL